MRWCPTGWACAAIALVASLGSSAVAAEPPVVVRVVSFNVLHGGPWSGFAGDGAHLERRLEITAAELAALRPDVVALQEASVSRRLGNVPARLAGRLGLHHVYAPATSHVFGDGPLSRLVVGALGFHEGPAILSRFPIAGWDVHPLPRCEHQLDPRVLLRARLDTPRGRLDVFSAHTSRDPCQVRRVAQIVGQQRNGLPSILMGDFNSVETSVAIRAMTEEAGFIDSYRRANPDARGATVWQRVDALLATASRRVDYIFVVPGLDVAARVRDSRVVLDHPQRLTDGTVLWPSDHYGVLTELELEAPPALHR
jgi:endonuclease/exonuclease/phosphatase family metal-dependent hydrolase